jgi:uncharacterized protein (UPF0332 family)
MFVSRGLEKPKTHSGLIAESGKRFVKDGPLDRTFGATLGKLESLRSYADYTLEPTPRVTVEQALEAARTFLAAIEAEVRRPDPRQDDPQ